MKLILVDGSALLYRSHFAFQSRHLQTAHGEITSASFGTVTTLLRLLEEEGAEGLVFAWDAKGKTFRHEMYPEYKAHRPPMPEDLRGQIDRVKEVVDAMGIPLLERKGFEADDLIGTLAKRAADKGHEVWIYSADKDFIPLLRDGIGLLKPGARGKPDRYVDHATMREELGLDPAQFRDVLALMGDKADNVPGVPGIGDKTARKLIGDFGNLESLLDRLDDPRLAKRQRGSLVEFKDQAILSQRLVTIDEEVEFPFDLDSATSADPQNPRFRELCRELEFRGILERLGGEGEAPKEDDRDYVLVDSMAALGKVLEELKPHDLWCLDCETTSLDAHQAELVGISLSVEAGRAFYIPVEAGEGGGGSSDLFATEKAARLPWNEVRAVLAPYLLDSARGKVGQNIKYDQIVLEAHGAPVRGVVFDTMIASFLLAPERRSHGMDALAEEVLGLRTTSFKTLFEGKGHKDIRELPLDELSHYACEDADITLRLYQNFAPELEEESLDDLMRQMEIPLSQVLLRMEQRGIRLDCDFLAGLSEEWGGEKELLRAELFELAGGEFNPNSPKQLQQILFDKLGLKPVKKTATGWSTDVEVLTKLADEHPLPAKLLDYRELQKLLSTYVESLPKLVNPQTGCVHSSFNQAVAATGRLSSTDPNLQNIPIRSERGRRIREAFTAPQEGWLLLAADYSQVELRLAAHFSGDEGLIAAFRRGDDIHAATAALVNGVELEAVDGEMRRAAKAINFGILYGMGARALGQTLGIKPKEAQLFIDQYFERLPRVREWIDQTIEKARVDGEVRTIRGRRRRLPELESRDPRQKSFGERIAINTPIQGSAADLIKEAMIALDARLAREELPARLLLQVHDELIVEFDPAYEAAVVKAVCEEMEEVAELSVPLAVDYGFGRSWAEAKA